MGLSIAYAALVILTTNIQYYKLYVTNFIYNHLNRWMAEKMKKKCLLFKINISYNNGIYETKITG